jgi:riboflavin kinase/FMN adenylyltransferase
VSDLARVAGREAGDAAAGDGLAVGEPIAVVRGVVVPGDRRGRLLGFPTANLRPGPGAELPPFGVYAGTAGGRPAAISIGVRPTYGDGLEPLLEAHLLDFAGDLYGSELEVVLLHRLRPELAFAGEQALIDQITADVAEVRRLVPVA